MSAFDILLYDDGTNAGARAVQPRTQIATDLGAACVSPAMDRAIADDPVTRRRSGHAVPADASDRS